MPPTYYSTTIVYSVLWIAVAALAGGGGFVLGRELRGWKTASISIGYWNRAQLADHAFAWRASVEPPI